MTDKIKQLAKQAYESCFNDAYHSNYTTDCVNAAFAELIVRECIAISKKMEDDLENHNRLSESNAVGIVGYRIARQFGVSE